MSLTSLGSPNKLGDLTHLYNALKEVQGLKISVVDGAAAGTKMNIAAMRTEDTIVAAVKLDDTWAAPTDDAANITIQSTKASGTITISGNPTADQTVTVNGVVYTWKATPTALNHVKITAGNNTTMATALKDAINAYETRVVTGLNGDANHTAQVVATSAAGVVTVTSVADGAGNGPIVTDTGTTITISSTDPGAVTATCVSVAEDDAITVNGITFTAKNTPTDTDLHADVKGTDTLMAAEFARVINAYQTKYGNLGAVATSALGVVTISASEGYRTGNSITLSDTSTNVACSGSGYLAGGTATGGIKSTTNLSTSTLVVVWFDKQ
jgi:hypothetical protein